MNSVEPIFNIVGLRQLICKYLPIITQISLWSSKFIWYQQLKKLEYSSQHTQYTTICKCCFNGDSCCDNVNIINSLNNQYFEASTIYDYIQSDFSFIHRNIQFVF